MVEFYVELWYRGYKYEIESSRSWSFIYRFEILFYSNYFILECNR